MLIDAAAMAPPLPAQLTGDSRRSRLIVLVTCLIVFLITYVVPNFAELYNSMQAQLPTPTLILIAIGTTARGYVLFGFVILVAAAIGLLLRKL